MDVPAEVQGERSLDSRLGDRRYRVRGLAKNSATHPADQPAGLARRRLPRRYARSLLGAPARRVRQAGRDRNAREGRSGQARPGPRAAEARRDCRTQQIRKALEPKQTGGRHRRRGPRRGAGAAARSATCSTASWRDFARCGVVGEETNKLAGYLAAVSRHLEAPLAVIVQSSSRRRQELADGSGAGVRARRAARAVLGHDRPVAVLHGRDGSASTRCWPSSRRRAQRAPPTR